VDRFKLDTAGALGAARTRALDELASRIERWLALTADAETNEILLHPLTGPAVTKWRRIAEQSKETWAAATLTDGATVLATPEVSETGERSVPEALIYPELHTRLVSWWLIHA